MLKTKDRTIDYAEVILANSMACVAVLLLSYENKTRLENGVVCQK